MNRTQGWNYSPGHSTDVQPRHQGIAHANHLVVDERHWPAVDRALSELRVGYRGLEIRYGLARILLDKPYDSVMFEDGLLARVQDLLDGVEPRIGRNRLVARAQLQFDSDDVEAAPKVVPSSLGPAKPASDRSLPPLHGPDLVTPVRVGVVDTPFVAHDHLTGSCLYAPASVDSALDDESPGHSTFVAGLILQVAPHAIVMAESAIRPEGVADLVAVHDAICRLTLGGAHLINLSLGCVTADDEEPFVLTHAIEWATRTAQQQDRAIPQFVAACGNSGDDRPFWPAADPRVCSVAAAHETDGRWNITDYSGYGAWVDVAAPGDELLSTRAEFDTKPPVQNSYAFWSGSSFATAIVTGLKAAAIAGTGTADLDGQSKATVSFAITDAAGKPAGDKTVPVYNPKQVQHQ